MIIVDTEKCVGCGECARDCLSRAIRLEDGCALVTRPCFLCGHCIAVCPTGAVSMDDWDMGDVIPFDPETCTVTPEVMLSTIKCRRSIRRFTNTRVEPEKLRLILEAGRFSPTASNAQCVSYIVFRDEAEPLRRIAMEEFRKYNNPETFAQLFPPPMTQDRVNFEDDNFLFKGADTIVLTISPKALDAGIASANMELVACSLGIGMLYSGFFVRLAAKSKALREYIGLTDRDTVASCLCFGYPAVKYQRSVPRKPLQAVWR